VQPEQGLVERREDECVRERHGRQEEGDVAGDVGDEERALHQSFAAGLTAQVLEAVELQGQPFEEVRGKKSHAWWRVSRPRDPVRVGGLLAGEDEDVDGDVGVLVPVVGVRVVAVVLVVPPGVAHAEQQVAVDEPDTAVGGAVAADLGMARVVAAERRAGTPDGEHRGQRDGSPGTADERHAGDDGGKRVGRDGARTSRGAGRAAPVPWRHAAAA
jgi:hypothetical protein